MKKTQQLIAIILGFMFIFCQSALAAPVIPSGHWAANALGYAVDQGYMQGDPDGNLRADDAMTRGEFAVFLCQVLGLAPGGNDHPFNDVNGHWSEAYVTVLYNAGIISGISATTYEPGRTITREEAAVLFARAFNLALESNPGTAFNDQGSIGEWALPYVNAMQVVGLINGDEQGNYNPKANITRAQSAQIVYNQQKGSTIVKPEETKPEETKPVEAAKEVGISTTTTITSGDSSPIVTVTITNDTFAAASESESIDNWNVSVGSTGLRLDSVDRSSNTQAKLYFTGTANVGTLTIIPEAEALTGGVAPKDAVSITVSSRSSGGGGGGGGSTGYTVTGVKANADGIILDSVVLTATLTGSGNVTYQWYRNDTQTETGATAITNATGSSYTLTSADTDKYVYVKIAAGSNTTISGSAISNFVYVNQAGSEEVVQTQGININCSVTCNVLLGFTFVVIEFDSNDIASVQTVEVEGVSAERPDPSGKPGEWRVVLDGAYAPSGLDVEVN